MKTTLPNAKKTQVDRRRKVHPGRAIVTVYRRKTPLGNFAFMMANHPEGGKRRFDSYSDEPKALEAAERLGKQLDKCDYVAASMRPTGRLRVSAKCLHQLRFQRVLDPYQKLIREFEARTPVR